MNGRGPFPPKRAQNDTGGTTNKKGGGSESNVLPHLIPCDSTLAGEIVVEPVLMHPGLPNNGVNKWMEFYFSFFGLDAQFFTLFLI